MGSNSKLVSLSPEICSIQDIYRHVGHALLDQRCIKRTQLPSYKEDLSKSKVNLTISPEKIDRIYYCKNIDVDYFFQRFELYCRVEYEGALYFVSMQMECETATIFHCSHDGEMVFTKDPKSYFQNIICHDFRNTVKDEEYYYPDSPFQNVICMLKDKEFYPDIPHQNIIHRYFRNAVKDKIVMHPSLYFQHVIVRDYRNSVKAKIRRSLLEDGYIIS